MKRIFLVSCLLALVLSSYAQKKIGKELFLGVKGGTTWSRLSITPKIKQQFEFGYISGVSMRYIEERFFGIIVELNFAQHGWKGTFEEKDSNYAYSRKLNYIELPFLAHIYFGKKAFRFFVNLGPQIGLCIGESASANFDTQNPPKFTIQRETEQYKTKVEHPFDYGLTGGGGFEFRIKERHALLLEGRYYFGLGDIFNNRSSDYFSVSSNQSILLSLSYQFNIRK
ncbi:MAG: porin family protein [Bacteroidales bacterium]